MFIFHFSPFVPFTVLCIVLPALFHVHSVQRCLPYSLESLQMFRKTPFSLFLCLSVCLCLTVSVTASVTMSVFLSVCQSVRLFVVPLGLTLFLKLERPPRWPSGRVSASRAEGPGLESRLRWDFFGVESYQRLKHWHSSGYPARRLAL